MRCGARSSTERPRYTVRIRRAPPIAAVTLAAAAALALAGCAGRAAPPVSPGEQVDQPAGRQPSAAEESLGRPAGVSIIQFGSLRTFWLLHCPTDSTSPLRGRCAMTRADGDPPPR